MRFLINNLRIFFLILALLLVAQLSVNAQEQPAQRTEPGDTSLLRPTQDDIKNAFTRQDEPTRPGISEAAIKQELALLTTDSPNSPPANDMFANAQLISGATGYVTGTNVDATLEPGEPSGFTTDKTVWYRWTAPSNLSMTFQTTAGTLSDTVLGVYVGSAVNSLTMVTWNDDINGVQDRSSRVTFIANAGTTYKIQVRGYAGSSGTFGLRWDINGAESWKQFNFDGNLGSTASDFAVFRPSTGVWWIWGSYNAETVAHQWGLASDYLVPGDYDGDGATDVAVWRPSIGTFFVLRSLDSTVDVRQWGLSGDKPVQVDIDGDDHADFAIWRPSTGTFWVINSTSGSTLGFQWGMSGDYLACGDYDGDGITDFGIQRNVGGYSYFYIYKSSDQQWYAVQFGLGSDMIVPGDYDHDGKNDIAVYRYGNNYFYYLRSSDGGFRGYQWGVAADYLVPGDYIGDDGSDICIWRPGLGNFYCLDPGSGNVYAFHWGMFGDSPVATSNVH
jgi:hypothetical protein